MSTQLRTQSSTFVPTFVGQSRLLNIFLSRHDNIAYSWYCAMTRTSFVPRNAVDIWKQFVSLTDQVIRLLLAEPFDCAQAQEIGVKLVDLHYIEPEALGNTQRVLMNCFSTGIAPGDLVALQPRLAVLLSEIAVGFSRHVREVILAEQEAIRRAWCNQHTQTEKVPQVEAALRESEARFRFIFNERKRMEVALSETQRRLMEVQEAERLHLARELHDSVVQQLFGISYQLVEVRRWINADTSRETVARALDTLREEVLCAVSQLRSFISDLRPAGLDELGLTTALEGYVARLERDVGPTIPAIVLDLDRDDLNIPKSAALCLFRAIQEALRNALRHAQAHHIYVHLRLQDGVATARVRDDGCGFHIPSRLSELAQYEHFGLVGITERVSYMGGRVDINSQPEMGTEVIIRVPLTEEANSYDTVSAGVIGG